MSLLAIPSKFVRCEHAGQDHQVDPFDATCTICKKPMRELVCPKHEKVYAHTVEQRGNEWLRTWICRVCLAEGDEPFPDATEYATLRGKKLRAKWTEGPLTDSPIPSLAEEYPRQRK